MSRLRLFRSEYDRTIYRTAAAQLGLRCDPDPSALLTEAGYVCIYGLLDGVSVEYLRRERDDVGLRSQADPPLWETRSRVTFAMPLDLGLDVRATPLDGPHASVTGDAAFDARLAVRGDEIDRVLAFLRPGVRAPLRAFEARREVELTDAGLTLSRNDRDARVEEIVEHVDALVAWGKLAAAAVVGVRVATGLRDAASEMLALGAKYGLAVCPTPLAMWGAVPGLELKVCSLRTGVGAYRAVISARLPEGSFPVTVRERSGFDAVKDVFTSDDFRTDDAAFDAVLHVSSDERARAKAVLTPAVRAALLGLRAACGFADVRAGVFNPESKGVEHARVGATVEALGALGRAALGLDEGAAPYR